MPGPESRNTTMNQGAFVYAVMLISPPQGVNLTALSSRLFQIWAVSSRFPFQVICSSSGQILMFLADHSGSMRRIHWRICSSARKNSFSLMIVWFSRRDRLRILPVIRDSALVLWIIILMYSFRSSSLKVSSCRRVA